MGVAIIAIGDELLAGRTLDYNSHWIAKRLTSLGFKVTMKMTVPDDEKEIIEAIQLALTKAEIVITTGGLGPTPGDVTLSAIAKALNKKLVLDKRAREMVKQRYKELFEAGFVDSDAMTPDREKMALVPEGASVFYNPIGVAPGVLLEKDSKYIIALPGVPSEMMYLLEKILPNLPLRRDKVIISKEWYIDFRDESLLAKILDEIMEKLEGKVRIKSYPVGFGTRVQMRIIAIAEASSRKEAEEAINKAYEELLRSISRIQDEAEKS
ncbi:MAG: competence/damage-inducible protein A [Candidatus Njordarchaeales archaeon]